MCPFFFPDFYEFLFITSSKQSNCDVSWCDSFYLSYIELLALWGF